MSSYTPAPTPARLAAGQTLTRALAAGDELFCAAGTLHLCSSALAGIDHVAGVQLQLRAGQSWRAPSAVWIQLTALDASAAWHCRSAPAMQEPAAAAAPSRARWRTRAAAWLRSWRMLGA